MAKIVQMNSGRPGNAVSEYEARLASEIDIYRDCTDVHNLPPIFHYWSNRYIRPLLEPSGFEDSAGMFLLAFEKQCAKHPDETVRFLSAGSGNCDLEVSVATELRSKGYDDFVIECVDLNPAMLERGADLAKKRRVTGNLAFIEADLNSWVAQREYHAVMADQSLHHVMELESLFAQIRQALLPDGTFVISDMIGRNGHLRWPRALAIVREFWRKLPPSYRCNCRSGRYEAVFEDADCSTESFEGIRAQDILGLLAETFHFQYFLGFGNVIDPFVDRSFGPNFDPAAAWDREFVDRVHQRDQEEMAAGLLGPTHMLAVLGTSPDAAPVFGKCTPPRIPFSEAEECVPVASPESGYEWGYWPHNAEAQLERTCRVLEDSESRSDLLEQELKRAIARTLQLESDLQERTQWAWGLDRQVKQAAIYCLEQEEELEKRAVWARGFEAELKTRTAWALQLESELTERTDWALRLDKELADSLQAKQRLQADLHRRFSAWLRGLSKLVRRLLGGVVDRIRNAGHLDTKATE